jgi:rubrerythrin
MILNEVRHVIARLQNSTSAFYPAALYSSITDTWDEIEKGKHNYAASFLDLLMNHMSQLSSGIKEDFSFDEIRVYTCRACSSITYSPLESRLAYTLELADTLEACFLKYREVKSASKTCPFCNASQEVPSPHDIRTISHLPNVILLDINTLDSDHHVWKKYNRR